MNPAELLEYEAPEGEFLEKWKRAEPYYMFFNKLRSNKATWMHPLSVTFSEILDKSMGDIKRSLHTTRDVEVKWMWKQYARGDLQDRIEDITVFCHDEPKLNFQHDKIKIQRLEFDNKQSSQHAKISIFQYRGEDEAIRIVVSSSNLTSAHWEGVTEGLWVSPRLPRMKDSAKVTDGDSKTRFKRDLLAFLKQYDDNKAIIRRNNIATMEHWRELVSRADCSDINVAFVASVHGIFPLNDTQWGHQKLGALLHEHMVIPMNEPRMSIVAQASSLGDLGNGYDAWVGKEFVRAMTNFEEIEAPYFKFIHPNIGEFELSAARYNNASSGHSSLWIVEHAQLWKSDQLSRTSSWPHIKNCTRLSHDKKKISFFLLGSQNLSKAAWGHHGYNGYRILNFEAGVVFIPKFVTPGEDYFFVREDPEAKSKIFTLPYDYSLTPYNQSSGTSEAASGESDTSMDER